MNKIFKHPAILIVLLTVIPSILLMFILSNSPFISIKAFFSGPFTSTYHFGNMLNNSAPLILTSLGAFIALKSNSFNLGGEGQVYLGATITGILFLYIPNLNATLSSLTVVIIVLLITGSVTFTSAWLEIKYRVNSLISTYLISMTLIHLCNYFVTGIFLQKGSNILTTTPIEDKFRLSTILNPSSLSTGFIIASIIVIFFTLINSKTVWGYKFNISGRNIEFSRAMGINNNIYKIAGLTISGALHGLAGYILVAGNHHAVIVDAYQNLGWNGLASALVAGTRPIMVIFSSLLYSYLDSGASYATIVSDVTIELSTIVKSVIFFVISSMLIKEALIKKGDKN